jgi:hypothetical protein
MNTKNNNWILKIIFMFSPLNDFIIHIYNLLKWMLIKLIITLDLKFKGTLAKVNSFWTEYKINNYNQETILRDKVLEYNHFLIKI